MKFLLIFICFISPFIVIGQQSVNITLEDGSIYKGTIFEYNEVEFKMVIKKRKIVTIPKSDIRFPKNLLINPSKFTTVIHTQNNDWYEGEIIIENDTSIMLKIGKELFKTIPKSDIAFRSNRAKKQIFHKETTIYTKDGNKIIGDVLGKNDTYTIINMEKTFFPQKIQNENIELEKEKYKVKISKFERVLIVIGSLYLLPALFAI